MQKKQADQETSARLIINKHCEYYFVANRIARIERGIVIR